jgi:hypothetical protein
MFRKVAIALVAASVIAAPALAEIAAPAPKAQTTTGTAPASTATAVKTVKADTAAIKHRKVARHHHHGTKMAKHVNHVKYAHHMKRSKVAGAAKPVATKPVSAKAGEGKTAPTAQVSTKPAAKSGVN